MFISYVLEHGYCSYSFRLRPCFFLIADISSPSFLGDYNQHSWVDWTIELDELSSPGVIEVTFTEFDIGCTYGTRLHVFTSEFEIGRTLCNLNKPIISMKSSAQNIYIRYLQNMNKQRLLELFGATYRITHFESVLDALVEDININSKFY